MHTQTRCTVLVLTWSDSLVVAPAPTYSISRTLFCHLCLELLCVLLLSWPRLAMRAGPLHPWQHLLFASRSGHGLLAEQNQLLLLLLLQTNPVGSVHNLLSKRGPLVFLVAARVGIFTSSFCGYLFLCCACGERRRIGYVLPSQSNHHGAKWLIRIMMA
jgi:hypothetical protein